LAQTAGAGPATQPIAVRSPPPPAREVELPPYDLAVDREARAAEARRELGERVPTAVVEDVFVAVGAPGWNGGAFTQSVRLMRDALHAYYNHRFAERPKQAIAVYLFPSAGPYEAFCKARFAEHCLSKYGFYRPDERRMYMNAGLGLGTLTHELVHPIVDADFPQAPTWINEGIASLFEAPVIAKEGEIHGVKNWRHPRLIEAFASSKERDSSRLGALFGVSDEAFRDNAEDLHYAMARYFCQWLDTRGKLWPFYQKWRDNFANDPTGKNAFTTVVGLSPEDANASWTRWVKSL
jgi:hypothetical protein